MTLTQALTIGMVAFLLVVSFYALVIKHDTVHLEDDIDE